MISNQLRQSVDERKKKIKDAANNTLTSDIMHTKAFKKFFLRKQDVVSKRYFYRAEEIR